MAKYVCKNIKIEVRDSKDVANNWQDISDHVQRVEFDYPVGELAICKLTIQCDPQTLRISGLPE